MVDISAKRLVDPKPSVDRIDELASRIVNGDILLPKFQREFVWDKEQILDLLDSILKNYPIGSVLFWLTRETLHSERTIADLTIRTRDPEYPVNYLLDGQQRLSTICGALYWSGQNKSSIWNIAFDLRTRTFFHLDTLDDPPIHQVRMNKLSNPSSFYAQIAALQQSNSPDKVALAESAEFLFNRIKDYKIATVTIGEMKLQDVAPIFERINSTGTRLTIVDLMRAATWSPDFDLIDTIDDEIVADIQEKGFGGFDRRSVLRNLSAAAGKGFTSRDIDQLRDVKADQLKLHSKEVRSAYNRAVDFLMSEAGVSTSAILPYANQVVVMAELFRVLGSLQRNSALILKGGFGRLLFLNISAAGIRDKWLSI